MNVSNVVKHKLPMQLADGNLHMFPTTIDMVYAEDGVTPLFNKQSGDWTANNALKLGGVDASEYARKEDIPAGGGEGGAQYINELLYDPNEEGVEEDNVVLPVKADDSDHLGGKAPEYYTNPRNLIRNGNFANPVNHNGYNTNSVINTFIIDDWIAWEGYFSITDGGIRVDEATGSPNIYQKFPIGFFDDTKSYTAVAWDTDGGVATGVIGHASDHDYCGFHLGAGKTYKFAALYEGTYTADNVPPPFIYPKRLEMLNLGMPVQPRNLLDNSNFRDRNKIVNQRGFSGGKPTGDNVYFIDRWKTNQQYSQNISIDFTSEGMLITPLNGVAGIIQNVPNVSTAVTFAAKINGIVYIVCAAAGETKYIELPNDGRFRISYGAEYSSVEINSTAAFTVEWAAIYEGYYTAETLPPYVTKGYTAELAECQRYFYKCPSGSALYGFTINGTTTYLNLELPQRMRLDVPSYELQSGKKIIMYANEKATSYETISGVKMCGKQLEITLATSREANTSFAGYINGYLDVSADL